MKNLQSKNNYSIFNLIIDIYILYSALITALKIDEEQISIGKILCEFVSQIKLYENFIIFLSNRFLN